MSLRKLLISAALSCAASILMVASPAAAAPSWVGPTDVSQPGQNAYSSSVGVDSQGNAISLTSVENGNNEDLQASYRPAGGAWQAPVTLATTTAYFLSPQIVFDGQGNAAAVWSTQDGSGWHAQIAIRSASAGAWRPTADICQPNDDCASPRIAVGAQGNAVAVWEYYNGADRVIEGATGSIVSGTWQQPVQLSASGASAFAPVVGLDAQGDATALWYRYSGQTAIIQSATRPAQGGAWSSPEPVSAPGLDTAAPQLAVDSNGDAVAVWESHNGTFKAIDSATRIGQGGAWSPPGPLSTYGDTAEDPQVAIDATGHATAIWRRHSGSTWIVEAADLIDLNGSWTGAHQLSPAASNASDPQIAVDQRGDTFAAWEIDQTISNRLVQGAARPAGASWSGASTLSSDGEDAEGPSVAADNSGDGVAVWTRIDPSNSHTQRVAVYDATPPTLSGIAIPATGTAGTPVSFAVTPGDAWSSVSTSWTFGDGATAAGAAATHTYATAGSYSVTVAATDAAGNTAQTTRTITIAPAPGASAGHKPRITRASLTPASFRVVGRGAVRSARARRGSVLRLTLSTDASASIVVTRPARGLRAGTRCVAPTAKLKRAHARSCSRSVRLGVLQRSLHAGRNAVAFTGRIGYRSLRAGTYRATATARNAYGISVPVSLRFRILR